MHDFSRGVSQVQKLATSKKEQAEARSGHYTSRPGLCALMRTRMALIIADGASAFERQQACSRRAADIARAHPACIICCRFLENVAQAAKDRACIITVLMSACTCRALLYILYTAPYIIEPRLSRALQLIQRYTAKYIIQLYTAMYTIQLYSLYSIQRYTITLCGQHASKPGVRGVNSSAVGMLALEANRVSAAPDPPSSSHLRPTRARFPGLAPRST